MRQDRPSDARKLVGQRNDGNVLVRSRQKPARPPAKRRLPLDEVRQHGSCAMDQVLANVWPAPSARVIFVWLCSVCFNVSGLGGFPRPRWRSAQPDPHNHSDLEGRSMVQAFKLPFDCQAIFLSPHADFSDPPAR